MELWVKIYTHSSQLVQNEISYTYEDEITYKYILIIFQVQIQESVKKQPLIWLNGEPEWLFAVGTWPEQKQVIFVAKNNLWNINNNKFLLAFFYFLAAKDIRKDSGNDLVEVAQLDLASLKSVRKCAENLLEKEDKIDYLINNAGKFVFSWKVAKLVCIKVHVF